MYQRVKTYVEKYHMLQENDHVITGVSGGADSVCLLFMLKELEKEMPLELTAVHIHHGLRGDSADADERYVKELCERLGVRCLTFHENVEQYAKEQRLTLEEAGRNIRRQIFEKVCQEKKGTKIALAHHQNDNAETLLWNLSRGCGLRGLGGISPVEGDPVQYIRPLLCVQRREIEAFLKEKGISYRTDETNLEDHYTRNRIRNHVIPYLEQEINPQAVTHMSGTMEQMRAVWTFMEKEMQKCRERYVEKRPCGNTEAQNIANENIEKCYAGKNDVKNEEGRLMIRDEMFTDVDETVRSFLIHALLCETAGRRKDIEQVHVKLIEDLSHLQTGRKIMLPYEMIAEKCYEGILLGRLMSKTEENDRKNRNDTNNSIGDESEVRMRVFGQTPETGVFPKKTYTKWFDYDIIKSTVKIRHKEPGDYITIDRNGGTQSLKKYFTNAKVPREERSKIWLAADGSHILWIIGYRQNQAYQVTDKTRRILEIEFNGGEEDGRDS